MNDVSVCVLVCVPVWLGVAPDDKEAVLEGVLLGVYVIVEVCVPVPVLVLVAVCVMVFEAVCDAENEAVCVGV